MDRKAISMKLEAGLLTAIDAAATAAGESRTAWLEQAARRRLEHGDQVPSPARPYRQRVPGPDVRNVTSSAQAKAGITPISKRE